MKMNGKSKIYESKILSAISNIIRAISSSIADSRIVAFFSNFFNNFSKTSRPGFFSLSANKSLYFKRTLSLRMFVAKLFENSILSKLLRDIYNIFYNIPLRTVAIFLLTFGIVLSTGSSFINYRFSLPVNSETFYIGIVLTASAIVLFPSKKSFIQSIRQSAVLSGFSLESNHLKETNSNLPQYHGYSTAFFFGIFCGIASFIFTFSNVLLFIIATFLVCLIFDLPETGLILTFALTPILSTGYIFFLIFTTSLSYIHKYFRCKRHLNTKVTDILALLSIPLILFCGIFTTSGVSDIWHAMKFVFCIIVVLLTSNLVRSTKTAISCVTMIINSLFVVATFNILLFILQYTEIAVEFSRYFSINKMISVLNIFSGFELGVFFSCAIPLIFSLMINCNKNERSKYVLLFAMSFICIILSSDGIAFTISVLSIIIILSYKIKTYAYLILPFAVFIKFIYAVPFLIFSLFGTDLIQNTTNGNITYTFKAIQDFGLFGIGLGQSNISKVLSSYSSSNTGSLLLQTILCLGIFGALYIIVFILSFLIKAHNFIASDCYKDTNVVTVCTGLYCACLNFMIFSTFSYTASDTRLIVFFMLCLGLTSSIITSSNNDHISEYVIRDHLPDC